MIVEPVGIVEDEVLILGFGISWNKEAALPELSVISTRLEDEVSKSEGVSKMPDARPEISEIAVATRL